MNVRNINKFFPESEETQKGRMWGQRQGFRSTKPATEEEEEEKYEDEKLEPCQHNIVITIHNMSRTLYTDQTRKLPRTSSHGNKYQMILPKIYSNSTWIEPMKNLTEGEIIISCERALMRIRLCGLKPKHKILDNEASHKYRKAIRASGMTYQIVPPDNHHCNIAESPSNFGRIISSLSSAAPLPPSPSTCGNRSSHKQKNNS